jgi:NAD(P)-dependent dehydrogenase (short-subunit alcohol dehydrogenase family)
VELLVRRGWTVYASVRRPGDAPPGSEELIFDVTDPAAVAAAAARVEALDGLVENAGIAIASPLEFLPPDELTRQLDVNVVGQLRVLQAFLPALRARRGRVVIVGSIAGRSALPFLGAYAMSKFALEAMADSLRVELRPWGMQVAIVEPGTIATAIWTKPQQTAESLPPRAGELYGLRLAQFRRLAAARSAGHAVPAEAVAQAIDHALTSAKPQARYVVGPDAKKRALVQHLPDRARDRVLTRFLFGSPES